jgi:hypothetical protein
LSAESYKFLRDPLIRDPWKRRHHDSAIPIPERIVDIRHQELSAARTTEDVLQVTRGYLLSWGREELARLPNNCRPRRVRDIEDVERWADRLVEESAHSTLFLEDEVRLDRMTSHFLIASVRLRQIAA